jgi:hypothetical protein
VKNFYISVKLEDFLAPKLVLGDEDEEKISSIGIEKGEILLRRVNEGGRSISRPRSPQDPIKLAHDNVFM